MLKIILIILLVIMSLSFIDNAIALLFYKTSATRTLSTTFVGLLLDVLTIRFIIGGIKKLGQPKLNK